MTPELKNKKKPEEIKNKQNKPNIETFIKKDTPNFPEKEVSVITKTTKPQVVVQSEKINKSQENLIHNWIILTKDKNHLIKFCCITIMGIIILLTFFLSLKTYNMIKDLYNIIL